MWIPVCNMFPLKSVTWDWCRAGVSWNHGADVAGADASTCFESSRLECQPGCIFPTSKHLEVHMPDFCFTRPSSRTCSVAKNLEVLLRWIVRTTAGEWVEKRTICPRQKRHTVMIWMNQNSYKDDRDKSRLNFVGYPWCGIKSYLKFTPNDPLWTLCGGSHTKKGLIYIFLQARKKGKSTLKKDER